MKDKTIGSTPSFSIKLGSVCVSLTLSIIAGNISVLIPLVFIVSFLNLSDIVAGSIFIILFTLYVFIIVLSFKNIYRYFIKELVIYRVEKTEDMK